MHFSMRKLASVVKKGIPVVFAASILISCSKERLNSDADQHRIEITDKETQHAILDQVQKMPRIGVYNEVMDKIIVLSDQNEQKSFSFVNPPSGGFNFSISNGGQWSTYVDEGGTIIVITEPGGGGAGGGGGTVVVGSTSLDIGFAFCFAVGDEVLGQGMFDTGINDVAGVVGIAGDLEALQTIDFEDEDVSLFDYFQGFVYYLVYAEDLANQAYEVLNWLEDLDQDEEDLDGFGFAYVVHFANDGGIYISKSGELEVDGSTIGFDGTYFCIDGTGFFDESGDEEPDVTEVPGFGAMGCE